MNIRFVIIAVGSHFPKRRGALGLSLVVRHGGDGLGQTLRKNGDGPSSCLGSSFQKNTVPTTDRPRKELSLGLRDTLWPFSLILMMG